LVTALGEQWPVYGLQPRGLDGELVPHSTVEAAAAAYLAAVESLEPEGPVHLIGYSFGGWVAFEMADRMRSKGRTVASVTLVDTEAPEDSFKEYRSHEVILELARVLEMVAKEPIAIHAEDLASRTHAERLKLLHERMVSVGLIHSRSSPNMLVGRVRTFGTNLRTGYRPERSYPDPIRLVAPSDPGLTPEMNQPQQEDRLSKWKRWAPNIMRWTAPGNHMTVLGQPHVRDLAEWWRQTVQASDQV
jgi:thioesterase domain-containing protein